MKHGNYITGTLFTLFFLAGCVPTRHLKGNEKLLYDVELNGVDQSDPDRLIALYRQKPNRKIPILGWTPYLSVYYFGKSFYDPAKIERKIQKIRTEYDKKISAAGKDSSKVADLVEKRDKKLARKTRKKEEGNWLMRSIGEPPAIYDSTLTVETVSQLNTYLSSKGYFHNGVKAETETKDKKVYLKLNVQENKPFIFTEKTYSIPDTALAQLVKRNEDQSVLKTGDPYDEEVLTKERDRLENLLRNQGYYEFRKQYITFDVDTSYGGNSVRVATIIADPNNSPTHKKYTLRNVYFVEDAGLNRFGVKRDTAIFDGVKYVAYEQYVSPKILDKKVRIAPGQDYSLIRTNRTQRQVTDLDVYRFSAVNYTIVPDSTHPQLDAFVNVSAAKRFQETIELGGNFSTFSAAQLSPLPFGSLRLKFRNVFGGAENLELGLRGGFEGQPSATSNDIVTTTELGTNLALYFPQFLIPFPRYLDPTYRRPDPITIYNPRTRLNAAYTFTDREDYTRTNTELSLAYFWQRSQQLQWIFSVMDLNIVNVPFLSTRFRDQLLNNGSNGISLLESFKTSVISDVNATRLFNSNDLNQTRDAAFLKLYAEIGNVPRVLSFGTLPGFSDLFKDVTKNPDGTTRYRSFSYAKGNADARRYIKLREKMFLVGRANLGLASPIPSGEGNILPYDRFFFAGGGSSVRAWRPRKLGPGSYSPPLQRDKDGNPIVINGIQQRDYSFQQPGEILMELNTEYRFNIFSIWDGALFMDAGNIWLINKDPNRPGGQISSNFWKEIAVGAGFGLRFDFTFLILRFDIATKIMDPAEPEGERFVADRFFKGGWLNSKNNQNSFNLGIGYPF